MTPATARGDTSLARYHDFSKRWVFLTGEVGGSGTKPIILRCASFRQFYDSAKRLSRNDLLRVVRSLWRHPERDTEQFATLLLHLHLFIDLRQGWTGFRDLWTRPSWRRPLSFLSHLWTWRARLRRRYRKFAAELARVAEQTPTTNPPVTAWTINSQIQLTRDSKRKHLVGVLNHYRARPPGDESRVLGCWAATRGLLTLALDDRNSVQVRRAISHYKRFISGRHGHFVSLGPLNKLVRLDLLHLCKEYPDYLAIEKNDKEFLENWFLARFSVRSALKVAFPRRFRAAISLLVGGVAMVLAIGTCDILGWRYGPIAMPDTWRYFLAALPLAVAMGLFAVWPQVFRLVYPRLFAGAVFGWTSIIVAIGSDVLFKKEIERAALGSAMLAMKPTIPGWILFAVVISLPLFFLYQEAYSAIGVWRIAVARSILTFFLLLVIVGIVGLVFVSGMNQMLCGHDETLCLNLHWRLLLVGCTISAYFAMITQLVWADKGISSTLAERGYVDNFEE